MCPGWHVFERGLLHSHDDSSLTTGQNQYVHYNDMKTQKCITLQQHLHGDDAVLLQSANVVFNTGLDMRRKRKFAALQWEWDIHQTGRKGIP